MARWTSTINIRRHCLVPDHTLRRHVSITPRSVSAVFYSAVDHLPSFRLIDTGLPLSALWLQDHGEITPSQQPDLPLLPADLDELPDWAYVGLVNVNNPGQGRQLFYKTVDTGRTPVRIVVYGTIREAHLSALGNWSG